MLGLEVLSYCKDPVGICATKSWVVTVSGQIVQSSWSDRSQAVLSYAELESFRFGFMESEPKTPNPKPQHPIQQTPYMIYYIYTQT